MLKKKLTYYDRFYPEPTQLQRTLVQEAEVYKKRQQMGLQDRTDEDRTFIDPETLKNYERMYRLPPSTGYNPQKDPNPATIKSHYGAS